MAEKLAVWKLAPAFLREMGGALGTTCWCGLSNHNAATAQMHSLIY